MVTSLGIGMQAAGDEVLHPGLDRFEEVRHGGESRSQILKAS